MVVFEDASVGCFHLVDQTASNSDPVSELADSQAELRPRLSQGQPEHLSGIFLDRLALLHCRDIILICQL